MKMRIDRSSIDALFLTVIQSVMNSNGDSKRVFKKKNPDPKKRGTKRNRFCLVNLKSVPQSPKSSIRILAFFPNDASFQNSDTQTQSKKRNMGISILTTIFSSPLPIDCFRQASHKEKNNVRADQDHQTISTKWDYEEWDSLSFAPFPCRIGHGVCFANRGLSQPGIHCLVSFGIHLATVNSVDIFDQNLGSQRRLYLLWVVCLAGL